MYLSLARGLLLLYSEWANAFYTDLYVNKWPKYQVYIFVPHFCTVCKKSDALRPTFFGPLLSPNFEKIWPVSTGAKRRQLCRSTCVGRGR